MNEIEIAEWIAAGAAEHQALTERMRAARSNPHFVYRVFDAADTLLYIGCTRTPHSRFKQHKSKAAWYPKAHHAEWTAFPNFATARAAESAAICADRPLFNIEHKPGAHHTRKKTAA